MFPKLFAESGLSLDRLRALVEVGAAGSIIAASKGDPVRQSLYSRQIKELEGFFQILLVERHGKGIRLTPGGRELARISRFFLLGLSNFQRGCLKEEQTYRIGAGATFADQLLLPVLAELLAIKAGVRYAIEIATDDEIERRLHDLTLDFGVVTRAALSRPLQLTEIGKWRLKLWAPRNSFRDERQAREAFRDGRLPFVLPPGELPWIDGPELKTGEPHLTCNSFLEARTALQKRGLAAFLPDFLDPGEENAGLFQVRIPSLDTRSFHYRLAWNPRLLRLNPHAGRRGENLAQSLRMRMSALPPRGATSRPAQSSGRRSSRNPSPPAGG